MDHAAVPQTALPAAHRRTRGQHGPRRSLALITVAAARRLGVHEARALSELAATWIPRAERRAARRASAQQREQWTYQIYLGYLRLGLPGPGVHVYCADSVLEEPLEATDARSRRRRVLTSPGLLSERAYRMRLLGETAEQIAE